MLPIACTLTDPELARSRAELLGGVLRDSKHVDLLSTSMPDPIEGDVQLDLTGPGGTAAFLADWLS